MRRPSCALKSASVVSLIVFASAAAHAEGTTIPPQVAAQPPTNAPATIDAPAVPPAAATVAPTPVAPPSPALPDAPASTANAATPARATSAGAPQAAIAAAPTATSAAPAPLERSFVHLGSSYPRSQLELKSSVDDSEWRAVCLAPCDAYVQVAGTLARVTAPGMTSSNAFRIAPGTGTALVRVDGGSARARSFGILGLSVGIPVSVAGMALFSYGKFADKDGMRISGAAVLGVGVVIVAVSLPLLLIGKTAVRDGNGTVIAERLASGHLTF